VTPTPDRQHLDDLKARVDLVALFNAHGVPVKKLGRGFKALCPYHAETTPSLSVDPKKGVYHCFGCGQSGDHLTFLQQHAKLSFPQAVAELEQRAGTIIAQEPPKPEEIEPFPFDLMERVAEIWHQAFAESPEGLKYLESRGLNDKCLLRDLQAGYCDGEKLLAITTVEERQLLQRVGVLNERGKEFFARCVVFPMKDRHNRVTGFYGRSILSSSKVPHRYCAGAKTGLFTPTATKGAQSVYLVEGVLDALALMQAGFLNTMALGGTQGLNKTMLDHLKAEKIEKILLCLDGDQAGQAAAEQLEASLSKEGFQVRALQLPNGQDPLSCPDLAAQVQNTPQPQPEKRKYRKLSSSQGKLKVLVGVVNEVSQAEATVDLYSARSRKHEATEMARALGLDASDLEQWFFQILHELEATKACQDEAKEYFAKVEVAPMTAQQRRDAIFFLKKPDLIETILTDMEALGYMGEEEAKLLGYCVSVSRKLEKPLSAIIQSGSGAGKSYLAETIIALTPPEEVVFYSRLSPQVLYHMPKDYLMNKLVAMEERAGRAVIIRFVRCKVPASSSNALR